MAKYTKKPCVVEAYRVSDLLTLAACDWGGLPAWVVERYDAGQILFCKDFVVLNSRWGGAAAFEQDWVVLSESGVLHACRGEMFDATYDPLETT